MSQVWSIVVAAGRGSRFGGAKQYELLEGRRILDWSLDAVRTVSAGVVLVVAPERVSDPEPAADAVVAGGESRSASVRCGLAAVPLTASIIVVHDAARPMAPPSLFADVVAAVRDGADAAVPGIRPRDTIKRTAGDRVVETVPRDELVAVQTPQAFRADALRAAHVDQADATDDAALVERLGGLVVVVPGDPANVKVTTPEDLDALRVPGQ